MKAGWVGTLFFIWVIAMIIGSINIGGDNSLFASDTATNPAQDMMSYIEVWSEQNWGTLINPTPHPTFFQSIWKMMILDLPLFGDEDSPWQIVRWLILGPIIATVCFGVVMLFISIFQRNI